MAVDKFLSLGVLTFTTQLFPILVEYIPCNDHSHACTTDVPVEMEAILPKEYSYRMKTYKSKEPEPVVHQKLYLMKPYSAIFLVSRRS